MITDPPKVTLSLTNAGPGNVVKVGDTVYLQCNVLSNPPVEKVYWKFQVHIHAHCNGNAHIPMQINDKDMSYKWDAQFSINGNKNINGPFLYSISSNTIFDTITCFEKMAFV